MNVIKSLGYQWVAAGFVVLVSLALAFILARVLGPEGFGHYSYILSIATIYAIIQDGGFRTLLFRENVDGQKVNKIFDVKLLPMSLGYVLITTIIGILFVTISPILHGSALALAIACMGLVIISAYNSALLKGRGLFDREAIWQILVRAVPFITIIITLILFPFELEYIFIAWFIGLLVALFSPLAKSIRVKPIFYTDIQVLRTSIVFLTIDAATVLYFRSDIILLTHLQDNLSNVGQYAAAYRMLEGVILIMTPVAHLAFRALRIHCCDRILFIRLLFKLILGMFFTGLTIVGISYWIGNDIYLFIFGSGFKTTGYLVFLIFCALIFILPNYILSQAAIALHREKYYAYTALLAAVLNIVLNIWLIPSYGVLGAASATIATEAFLFIALSIGMINWLKRENTNWS
jgi:O-antigen/teichoic acid export membrane protein